MCVRVRVLELLVYEAFSYSLSLFVPVNLASTFDTALLIYMFADVCAYAWVHDQGKCKFAM